MVNFRNLADKAKDVVEKRGGTESLKQDAEQLKGIAKGPGSLSDKAKAAVSALKEPGTASQATGAGKESPGASQATGAGKGSPGASQTAGAGKESPGAAEAPTSAPPAAESAKPTPKQAAGKAKADAAVATGTTAGKGKRPPEEVGGAK